ncbi:Integration host factor subunit alpha [Candidatus Bealeia paramacronuclearis]|uniref:Integration host factor subunit alpha n=1 Tax=Candidatus Bealeia paramacronuclearis TaxID=1921001 RepID=A0ABZ2C314_9PROT|nr:Integration host factor subunit alpha [Candidatus Bealeia paramacronuclearis]
MKTTTLTRADIVDAMAREMAIPRQMAVDFFEMSLDEMIKELEKSGCLKVSSFGSFNVRSKTKRIGRNPKTGKEAVITPRKVVSFKPSHLLRERVVSGK